MLLFRQQRWRSSRFSAVDLSGELGGGVVELLGAGAMDGGGFIHACTAQAVGLGGEGFAFRLPFGSEGAEVGEIEGGHGDVCLVRGAWLGGEGGLGVRDHERQSSEEPTDVAAGHAADLESQVRTGTDPLTCHDATDVGLTNTEGFRCLFLIPVVDAYEVLQAPGERAEVCAWPCRS